MAATGRMQLGITLPLTDIGGDPDVVRDFAQAAEALGYDHLAAPDHVLGANVANRPGWGSRNTSADLFHDPFVLFGFLAGCTERIGFSTQVMILPQRQTALVAKQAACLDVLSRGRFRFGVGIGWNPVEYEALGESFSNRGRRMEEQIEVMRALWAEDHVSHDGRWHRIDDAGIRPRPASGSIPLWFGAHEDTALERAARLGDGWIMLACAPDETATAAFARFHDYGRQAGRDPRDLGIEVWASLGDGDEETLRRHVQFWKAAGVSHVTVNNCYGRYYHERISERTLDAHMAAMKRYREVVADLL